MERIEEIIRTPEEINEVLNTAADGEMDSSKFPGQNYESGIATFWRWLTEKDAAHPFEE